MRADFNAYTADGKYHSATWAESPGSIFVEKMAYQERLDRGDFGRVEVFVKEGSTITHETLHRKTIVEIEP